MPVPLRPPSPELLEAFRAWQRAATTGDHAALRRLIAPGPTSVYAVPDGLVVGHDAIAAALTRARTPAASRLVQTHVQVLGDDHALIVAVTESARGGRSTQTQLWARSDDGWQLTAAHVTEPAPALDTRIWRVVGDPLVPSSADSDGPLAGETVAVKDVFAVAGHRIGAGNPDRLHHAEDEPAHADAVRRLIEAGAVIRGIARTDEFAYAMTGRNEHDGTPPNPAAPHRLPGGSSSGPASAVALGQATIGLGTDTAGSIRVPASYQGLFGIRTTHGLVDRVGLTPLAPSFDAIGWLSRSAFGLNAVGDALLPDQAPRPVEQMVQVPELTRLAEPEVAVAVSSWVQEHIGTATTAATATTEDWPLDALPDWVSAFQTVQAYEAWAAHRDWLATRLDTLGRAVRSRFETGARLHLPEQADTVAAARDTVATARARIRELVGDRVLVLPSAASAPPSLDATAAEEARIRAATLRLTSLASLAGLPAVSIPIRTAATAGGLPVGVCLVGAPGRDRDLLLAAIELAG